MKTVKKSQIELLKKFLIKDGWKIERDLERFQVIRATKQSMAGRNKMFVINDGPNADSDCYYVPQFSDPIVDAFYKDMRQQSAAAR